MSAIVPYHTHLMRPITYRGGQEAIVDKFLDFRIQITLNLREGKL